MNTQQDKKAQIGASFDGGYRVWTIGNHHLWFIKNDRILLKLRRPDKCPKTYADIEILTDFKDCTDNDILTLLKWFLEDYVNCQGKTINGWTYFDRLEDEFLSHNEK